MTILAGLLASLPTLKDYHDRECTVYKLLADVARQEVEKMFADRAGVPQDLGHFGKLSFPYQKLGSVDSLSLFDLDELIIFSYYWQNRSRYRRVADIGANIGLHSTMLDKCGYEVRCFEPDPNHAKLIAENLKRNNASHVTINNVAVSSKAGTLEFVRVLGNTTGSHIAGAKENPYGQLERFPVEVAPIGPIMEWADLVKLDAEGHEKEILLATTAGHWEKTEMLVEIQNSANAKAVYEHLSGIGVNLFAQKLNWQRCRSLKDIPTSYKEGTLFVSPRESMSWG
ncbi:MAG: FkbM family methyltransferase [Oligoflexia bacterium]|nr:FkbM family methyltransferase [Oligoflexia bacterium]